MTALLHILMQIMFVLGQGHVGVTPVCVIVVFHVINCITFLT